MASWGTIATAEPKFANDSAPLRLQSASTHMPPIGSQRPSATRCLIASKSAG